MNDFDRQLHRNHNGDRHSCTALLSAAVCSTEILGYTITQCYRYRQGDHLSGKPEKVRELNSSQGNVRAPNKSQNTRNHHHHHHNHFMARFPGPPRWAGARIELLDFMVHGRLTEADTPTIRLGAIPSGPTSAHLHRPPWGDGGGGHWGKR